MKSIRTKILAFIGGIVILALIVSAIVISGTVRKVVMDTGVKMAQQSTNLATSNINNFFTRYIYLGKTVAEDEDVLILQSNVLTPENLKSYTEFEYVMEKMVSSVAVDKEGVLALFMASAKGNVSFASDGWISDSDYNYREKPYWFTDEKDLEIGYKIAEPYLDMVTNDITITVALPIWDKNNKSELAGVVGVDVRTKVLSDMVKNTKTAFDADKSNVMLITPKGVIMTSNNSEDIMKIYPK